MRNKILLLCGMLAPVVYVIAVFISGIIIFISGGLAAYTGATLSPILGLMERITIGGFLQWLFVIALKLFSAHAPKEGI